MSATPASPSFMANAIRALAMDAVQALAPQTGGAKPVRFVVAGASKRGWSTWLTAAADARVAGMPLGTLDWLDWRALGTAAQSSHGGTPR